MTSVDTTFKFFLHNHFKLKDLSPLKYFVGLEIERSTKDMHFPLPTHIYGPEILLDTGFFFVFLGCKPVKFPKLTRSDGALLGDPSGYQRIIGKLLCLTLTMPDLIYCVH